MAALIGLVVAVLVVCLLPSLHAQLLSGCPIWGCLPSGTFALNASVPYQQGRVEVVWKTELTNKSLPSESRLGCVTNENNIVCPVPSGFVSVVSDTGEVAWRTEPLLHDPPLPLLDVYGDFIACDGRYLCKVDNNGAFVKPNIEFPRPSTVFSLNIAQNGLFLITSKSGELICYDTAGIPYASTFLPGTVEDWNGTFIPVSTPVLSGNRAYFLTEFKVDEGLEFPLGKASIPRQTRLYAIDVGSSMIDRLKEAWHIVLYQSYLPLATEGKASPASGSQWNTSSGRRSGRPFGRPAEGLLYGRSPDRLSGRPRRRASAVNLERRSLSSYRRFYSKRLTLEPNLLVHAGIVYVSSPAPSQPPVSSPGSSDTPIQGRLWAVQDRGTTSSQLFSIDVAPSHLSLLDAQFQSSPSMNVALSGSAEQQEAVIAHPTEILLHFRAGIRVQEKWNQGIAMRMSLKVSSSATLPTQMYQPVLWVTPQGDNGTILGITPTTGKVVQRIPLASILGVTKATVTSKVTCVGSAMTSNTPYSLVFGAMLQKTSLAGREKQGPEQSWSSLVAIRVSAEKPPVLLWSVPLTSDGETVGQISASWTTGKSPQRLLFLAVTNSEKAGATLHAVG